MKTTKIFWHWALLLIGAALIVSSCKKEDDDKNLVKDIDGNVYKTVKIGTQEWFAENLRTTRYNNGTSILNITDSEEWIVLNTGAYAWHQNNEAVYKDEYGALYNWHAVNTGSLCPTGWRVPTAADWTLLTDYAGGKSVAGGKLKDVGTTRWASPNTGATDEYGFSALPGGTRHYFDGAFNYLSEFGFWWSSTENDATSAWSFFMTTNSEGVSDHYSDKKRGSAVRCIRDN